MPVFFKELSLFGDHHLWKGTSAPGVTTVTWGCQYFSLQSLHDQISTILYTKISSIDRSNNICPHIEVNLHLLGYIIYLAAAKSSSKNKDKV